MAAKRKIKRYAFWSYDLCPFILGGEISKPKRNGLVMPDGYQGIQFEPLVIIRGGRGKIALKLIKLLRAQFVKENRDLKDKIHDAAKTAIGIK